MLLSLSHLIYLSLAVWGWIVLPLVIPTGGFVGHLLVIHHCGLSMLK